MDPSYLTQIITFLTLVGSIIYQIYRENRQRRWDTEDKKAIAIQLAQTNIVVEKIHVLTNSAMLLQKLNLARVTEAKAAITKDVKDIAEAQTALESYLEHKKEQDSQKSITEVAPITEKAKINESTLHN